MQVYKIGVQLMLAGNITAGLAAISKSLLGINAQVKQLQTSFTGLKAAITGALAVYAGVKTLEFLGKMVKHGNEIVHQQQLMRAAGMSQQQVAEATAKAYENSARVQTTTVAENLKHLRELRYAFGDLGKAQAAIQQVSQTNSVLQSLGGTNADQVWDIVKAIEMKGGTIDPKQFSKYIDDMTKVMIATGGKVTPRQYFSTFKYGRTAMQGWDESFVSGALPRLIQSMSGGGGNSGSGGPGNALMSGFAAIVQGQMSQTAAGEFDRLGIGTSHKMKGSSKSQVDVASKNLFIHNPYEWVQQVLMPALAAKGITSQDAITGEIGKMFPNRTAGQIMTEMALQGRFREGASSQFEKDIALQKQPMGANDAFKFLMNNDLNTNMKAFTQQWNSMLEALGAPLVPTAVSVLKSLTGAFTWVQGLAQTHPDTIRRIAEGLGVFAAAAIGLTVGAAAAAIVAIGAIPALIGAAVGALAALVALNWNALTGFIGGFYDAIKGLWDGLKNLLTGGGVDRSDHGIFTPGSYSGDSSGLLHRISYGSSSAIGMGGSASTGGGASRSIGGSASTGGGAGGNMLPGNLTGNAYISAMRAPFAAELADPAKRMQFAAMLLSEGNPLQTAESAMNRSNFRGMSLMAMLHSGFYGPINRGKLPNFMAQLRSDPKLMARMNAAINGALGGSDTIQGSTDQGMVSDPNGGYILRHFHVWGAGRGNIYGDWLRGHGTEQWRQNFEGRARGSAVPPPKSSEVHVQNKVILDGRVVAENTMKHMAHGGNKAASGGRLYDRSYTRPISI